jgi:hypothetical protein
LINNTSLNLPSCMKNVVKGAIDECRKVMGNGSDSDLYLDNCVLGSFFINRKTHGSLADSTNKMAKVIANSEFAKNSVCTTSVTNGCAAGYVVFDGNCNPVKVDTEACGADGSKCICKENSLAWLSSPISLIWNEGINIESESSFVQFPLSKSNKDWYVWKASGNTPLVVYDPDHTGQIHSAEQLFGEWTFGGKSQASLMSVLKGDDKENSATPWRDGFEALASLDRNYDGKVSDNELEPLGLWFDENRDGISQDGEVRPLREEGVKALYFSNSYKDKITKSVIVSRGFDRVKAGKMYTGEAVDWYGEGASSQYELISKHIYQKLLDKNVSQTNSANSAEVIEDSNIATVNGQNGYTGSWFWKTKGNQPANWDKVDGILFLDETEDGKVSGKTYVESQLESQDADSVRGTLTFMSIEGSLIKAKDGVQQLDFTTQFSGASVKTTARLSEDKATLLGTTEYIENLGGDEKKVSYNWEARRVQSVLKE